MMRDSTRRASRLLARARAGAACYHARLSFALRSPVVKAALPLLCLALLLATGAQAKEKPKAKPLPGDAEYRQALPYLDQARQQIAGMEKGREAGQDPAAAAKPFRAALSSNLNQAIPLLDKAARQRHPVAELRLAQVLADFAQDEKSQKRVCELLGDSLKQGFAPAALEVETLCPDLARQSTFTRQAEAAARSTRYAGYFPQPSHALGWCQAQRSMSLLAAVGSQRDYQADLYFMLAGKAPQAKRQGYLQQAGKLGCAQARQALGQG